MVHLSVVIPVYNESSLIDELVKRVKINVKLITDDYEIVIIDDGSQDDTWKAIEDEAKTESRIKGIKFSRNFGHHYAITAGLHNANGEWIVVMDGDLQDRPEVIPELYRKAQSGFDVVFVSRKNRPEKIYYLLTQKFFYFLLKSLSGVNFDSSQANFSILNKKVVDAFVEFPEKARFYSSTIMWLGFNRTQIYAEHGKRFSGQPSYTLKKRIKLAADIILAFSERPLKFAVYVGVIISSVSILMTIYLIYASINNSFSVIGWPSLVVLITFFSGTVILMLGVLGLYVGRIFEEVKRRPLYVISNEINNLRKI